MTPGKRAFDLLWTTLGLMVLWPVLGVIALCVKWHDGGSVLFAQERVGYCGRQFRMWKFRTMVADAERRGLPLTVGADPRVTRPGRWLRALKLDELPQLFNVLRGEMSLVGPRPEVPRYVALYTPEQRRVLELTPGVTDPASVRYRNESEVLAAAPDPERTYVEWVMPEKIRLNLDYAARATPWLDFLIVLTTLRHLLVPVVTPVPQSS